MRLWFDEIKKKKESIHLLAHLSLPFYAERERYCRHCFVILQITPFGLKTTLEVNIYLSKIHS